MNQHAAWRNSLRIGTALLLLTLCACGFHLRGALPLAKPLHSLYIQSSDPYGTLVKELEQSLKMSHAELAVTPNEAQSILAILHDDTSQTLLSVSGTAQTRQYRLMVTVIFSVTDTHGTTILAPEALTESRIITIQSNQILGSSNQANMYYQQMRRALASSIMYRLSSGQVADQMNQFAHDSKKPTT